MLDDDETVAEDEQTNGPVIAQAVNGGVQLNGNIPLRFVPYAPNGRGVLDETEDFEMAS